MDARLDGDLRRVIARLADAYPPRSYTRPLTPAEIPPPLAQAGPDRG